ncbi:MAG TPA: CoA pyrophosphatase [Gammaproteobacteria bacterium]|nr:CoA pyrophosphatase [Gammaproteobacteria bacterium]
MLTVFSVGFRRTSTTSFPQHSEATNLLRIENIHRSLNAAQPDDTGPVANARHAAVAAILRPNAESTEALFILRATKDGDPWSGQMAFPGGHYEPRDGSLRVTAERETQEEIGLDLVRDAKYLGKIPDVKANPRGQNIEMIVSPYIYVLENPNPTIALNYEVAEVLWGSLNDMYSGESVTRHNFSVFGREQAFPGYSVGDQVVWGLTLRMLDHFFTMLDPQWQPRYE